MVKSCTSLAGDYQHQAASVTHSAMLSPTKANTDCNTFMKTELVKNSVLTLRLWTLCIAAEPLTPVGTIFKISILFPSSHNKFASFLEPACKTCGPLKAEGHYSKALKSFLKTLCSVTEIP